MHTHYPYNNKIIRITQVNNNAMIKMLLKVVKENKKRHSTKRARISVQIYYSLPTLRTYIVLNVWLIVSWTNVTTWKQTEWQTVRPAGRELAAIDSIQCCLSSMRQREKLLKRIYCCTPCESNRRNETKREKYTNNKVPPK